MIYDKGNITQKPNNITKLLTKPNFVATSFQFVSELRPTGTLHLLTGWLPQQASLTDMTVPTGSTKPAVSFIIIVLMADLLSQGVLSGTEWSFKVLCSCEDISL